MNDVTRDPDGSRWEQLTAHDHLYNEIKYAKEMGHEAGDPPVLPEGAPCPGCFCAHCKALRKTADPRFAEFADWKERRDGKVRDRMAFQDTGIDFDAAKAVPIEQVIEMLELGELTYGRWGSAMEARVICPLHEDNDPSLRVDTELGVWYCDPCGVGGDSIRLVELVEGLEFVSAVCYILGVSNG